LGAQPFSREEYRTAVASTVDEIALSMDLLVDPLVTEFLVSDLDLHYGSFCERPNPSCKLRKDNPQVLRGAIRGYLGEYLRARPSSLIRLAARIGDPNDMASLGQTESMNVAFAIVVLTNRSPTTGIVLNRLPRPITFSGRGSRLLTLAGRAELGRQDHTRVSWTTLQLVPNQQVTVAFGDSLPTGAASMGSLTTSEETHCPWSGEVKHVGPHAVFDGGRATIRESPEQKLSGLTAFARAPVVDLTLNVDAVFGCGADCQRDLAAVFVRSFAAWHGACQRCDLNSFTFLRIRDNVWISWALENRLRTPSQSARPTSLDLNMSPSGESGLSQGALLVGSVRRMGYTNITDDLPLKQQICALPALSARWVRSAQALLCSRGSAAAADLPVVRASLNFMNGPTSCGDIAVACGLPNTRVEVNAARYGFIIPRSTTLGGEYRLGKGSDLLDFEPVVMHEVGHWFGVPHSDVAKENAVPDIMATPYGSGPSCISRPTAIMANNAAVERWSYRVKDGGGALMPPVRPLNRR